MKTSPNAPLRPIRTTFYDVYRNPVKTTASSNALRAVANLVGNLQSAKYSGAVSAEVWNARTTKLYAAAVVTPTEMHVYYAQRLRGVSPEGQKGKPAISGLTRDNPA